MSKTRDLGNITNVIKTDANGNITFVSGSATLMTIGSTGAITTTGVISGSNALSASYATSASYANAFTVAGTLTAQTLVVQTITASVEYSSGSNVFGNSVSNTHQFTGSLLITGSIGIGTLPSYALEVNSNQSIYTSRFHQPSSNTSSYNAVIWSGAHTPVVGYVTTGGSTVLNSYLQSNMGIGTQNAYGLVLVTNDTGRLYISASGNVGIGTSTPNTLLDIRGGSNTQGVAIGGGATSTTVAHGLDTNARYLTISGNGSNPNYGVLWLINNTTETSGVLIGTVLYGQAVSGKSGSNTGTKTAISSWTAGSGGSVGGYGGYMSFFTRPDNAPNDIGSYERMRIDMNGNIGIGTTSPAYALDISGSSARINVDNGYLILNRSVNTKYVGLSYRTANAYKWFAGMRENSTDDYIIYSETAATDALRISNSTGTVTFSANANQTSNFTFQNTDTTNTNSRSYFNVTAGNTSLSLLALHSGDTYIAGTSGRNMYFQQNPGGTVNAMITSGGLLKINTTGTINDTVYKFAVRQTTDRNIAFGLQGGDSSIEAFNDAVNTNTPLRIYGAPLYFPGANVKMISGGANYNENIRTYAQSNDYSSYILGAVAGDSGSGVGQWSIVRWPSANSYQFTIRYNNTDFFYLYANGNYSFYGSNVSDARKKTNITYIEDNQLDTIMKLKPATFNKINPTMYSETDETYTNDNTHTGFIAQDVLAENIPNILTGNEEEGYGLDYDGILSLTVKALQELKLENDSLKSRIEALENK